MGGTAPATLGGRIAATLRARGAAPALLTDGTVIGADALLAASGRCAAGLAAAGVRAGDRVAVGLPNSPDLVRAVLGVLHAGATLVPFNPVAPAEEVRYLVGDARPRAVIGRAGQLAALGPLPATPPIVLTRVPDAPAPVPPVPLDPDAPALIVYTSGSTGRPKGAVLSHRALLANLTVVADAWRWTPADRLLLTLPCFHLHGLGLGLLMSFLVGSSVVLRPRFVAGETLADLAGSGATVFFGVPTMYARLLALPEGAEAHHDLSRMRLWVSGSAALPAPTFERFRQRFGHTLLDRYGMTECGFVLSGPYDGPRRPGVVGLPLPGVEVRLLDRDRLDHGECVEVPDGTPGELLVRSPGLFDGYWQRPADTAAVMVNGWLRSGDIAVREADGMYRIVGRASVDIIKSRGFRIGAGEIEAVLQEAPGVEEAAVVGVPDADQGERVVAVVTARPGARIDVAAVLGHARAALAPHKVPSAVAVVDELPRVGPGKFRKADLVTALAAGRLRAETG